MADFLHPRPAARLAAQRAEYHANAAQMAQKTTAVAQASLATVGVHPPAAVHIDDPKKAIIRGQG